MASWHWADGGESWELRGAGLRAEYVPPELAYDPVAEEFALDGGLRADPDTLWIQHHNGVFLSRDAGRNSRKSCPRPQPSPFGFAVAAHPDEPHTAWFVPAADDACRVPVDARLVVSRHARRRRVVRGAFRRPAAAAGVRHRLPPRAGRGRRRPPASFRLHDRRTMDQRRCRRPLACLSHTLPPVYCVRFG